MDQSGNIDYAKYRHLLQWHLKEKTDGLCVLGTTSEAAVMSMDERAALLEITREEVAGKVPVVVGCGTIDPRTVIEYSRQALRHGADASLIVTPYYVKPTQRALVKHYEGIADAVPTMPILLYNVPGRTGVDMKPETIGLINKACAGVVVGVKEATGDVSRVAAIRETCGKDFLLYGGDDETGAEFVMEGGDGVISVTANVAPNKMHLLMRAALSRDKVKVKEINDTLMALHSKLFCQSNPIPAKYVLEKMGIMQKWLRPPLCALEKEYEEVMHDAMRQAGLLLK